jgi:hypothetical protein
MVPVRRALAAAVRTPSKAVRTHATRSTPHTWHSVPALTALSSAAPAGAAGNGALLPRYASEGADMSACGCASTCIAGIAATPALARAEAGSSATERHHSETCAHTSVPTVIIRSVDSGVACLSSAAT